MHFTKFLALTVLVCGCFGLHEDTKHSQPPDLGYEVSIPQPTTTIAPPKETIPEPSSSTTSLIPPPTQERLPPANTPTSTTLSPIIKTFEDTGEQVCTVHGKPLVRVYGKSGCHNCEWSDPLFDEIAAEYVDAGLIVARHWIFVDDDDSLTPEKEDKILDEDYAFFFEENPSRTVPYFDFGCRFRRVGNGYQVRDQPFSEKKEYREVLDQLVAQVNSTSP